VVSPAYGGLTGILSNNRDAFAVPLMFDTPLM